MHGFLLPSHLGRVMLALVCLGSPRFQHSPDSRALSGHVWIYTGLGAVTCQPPDAAFLRAGGALLALEASFVPSEWA